MTARAARATNGAALRLVPGDGGTTAGNPSACRSSVGVWYLWLVAQGGGAREGGPHGPPASVRRSATGLLLLVD